MLAIRRRLRALRLGQTRHRQQGVPRRLSLLRIRFLDRRGGRNLLERQAGHRLEMLQEPRAQALAHRPFRRIGKTRDDEQRVAGRDPALQRRDFGSAQRVDLGSCRDQQIAGRHAGHGVRQAVEALAQGNDRYPLVRKPALQAEITIRTGFGAERPWDALLRRRRLRREHGVKGSERTDCQRQREQPIFHVGAPRSCASRVCAAATIGSTSAADTSPTP